MVTQFAAAEAQVGAWRAFAVVHAQHHLALPRGEKPRRRCEDRQRNLGLSSGPVLPECIEEMPLRPGAGMIFVLAQGGQAVLARFVAPFDVGQHGVLKTQRVSYAFTASQLSASWRAGEHALFVATTAGAVTS
jgi:hypothetical protein